MAPDHEGKRPELVIFDCDGVLVDSEPTSNRVLASAISEAGLSITAAEVGESFEAMRLADIAAAVERQLGKPLPEDWIASFEQRRAAEFQKGLDPIPGIAEALARIITAGTRICVASQARREKTELTLDLTGLLEHFEPSALFSSTMVARGKPDPDLFLHAAQAMGAAPASCVVVEDAVPGARAGRLAGMPVLGYAPDGKGERLAHEGAVVFDSMEELPALLGLA
jgi:HAD superfamily hydrolase (TIGR01509 family)